jgi:hypothetical protein
VRARVMEKVVCPHSPLRQLTAAAKAEYKSDPAVSSESGRISVPSKPPNVAGDVEQTPQQLAYPMHGTTATYGSCRVNSSDSSCGPMVARRSRVNQH